MNTYFCTTYPPSIEPTRDISNCQKNTRLILFMSVDVIQPRSSKVGPKKATHIPKLQNTLQYVTVGCQFCKNRVLNPLKVFEDDRDMASFVTLV